MKKVYFILPVILILIILFASYIRILGLSELNKELSLELSEANSRIATLKETNELRIIEEAELRNILDLTAYEILDHLEKGDLNYLRDKVTENVLITEDKLFFRNKYLENSSYVEYIITKNKLLIRQRAYKLNESKDEFISIYEILSGGSQSERINTLNFSFVLKDDKWLLDWLKEDE